MIQINDERFDVAQITNEIEEKGFVVLKNVLKKSEILTLTESEIPSVLSRYKEFGVQERVWYKREEGKNRQGDAVMLRQTDGPIQGALPFMSADVYSTFTKFGTLYNAVLEKFIGIEMAPEYRRFMLNVQQYFADSFEVADHFDGSFLDYSHFSNDKYSEVGLEIKKALLPQLVMVLVLENENDGKGTYLRELNSEERIPVENNPGDIIIFDNIGFRHGVPRLENPRKMIGYRNFDYFPILFESNPENKEGFEKIEDVLNPGYAKLVEPKISKELQLEFNKKWKETLYEQTIDQKPAF